jgi:hypothetical protein
MGYQPSPYQIGVLETYNSTYRVAGVRTGIERLIADKQLPEGIFNAVQAEAIDLTTGIRYAVAYGTSEAEAIGKLIELIPNAPKPKTQAQQATDHANEEIRKRDAEIAQLKAQIAGATGVQPSEPTEPQFEAPSINVRRDRRRGNVPIEKPDPESLPISGGSDD